jgi:hypothetical protein
VELPGAALDTAAAIERRVIDGLVRMAPEERLARTFALCRAASELAMAGIRLREGDLPEADLRLHLARLRYGSALVERVQAYQAKRLWAARRGLLDLLERALTEAAAV